MFGLPQNAKKTLHGVYMYVWLEWKDQQITLTSHRTEENHRTNPKFSECEHRYAAHRHAADPAWILSKFTSLVLLSGRHTVYICPPSLLPDGSIKPTCYLNHGKRSKWRQTWWAPDGWIDWLISLLDTWYHRKFKIWPDPAFYSKYHSCAVLQKTTWTNYHSYSVPQI